MITLHILGGVWHATSSGPEAAAVTRLFGTATLPTPYTAAIDPRVVLGTIQRLNPDERVCLACAGCGDPIVRDYAPTDPTLVRCHAGCRPGAGRIAYNPPQRDRSDPFDR